jgi:hypothetical protein
VAGLVSAAVSIVCIDYDMVRWGKRKLID